MAVDSLLFDRFGTRISSNTLYKTPSQRNGEFRPIAKPRAKTYEAVSSWQRREMVDVSRVIAKGVQNIRTALIQAGEFSVGDSWHMKSRSKDKAWGKKRDEAFNKFYARDCNMRGRQSDWRSTLRQLNWTRKVEADYGIVFDGLPYNDPLTGKQIDPTGRFQIIKFDRIATGLGLSGDKNGSVSVGNGLDKLKELPKSYSYYGSTVAFSAFGIYIINDKASRFDGYRIIDGIIVDANMRRVGFRLTGFTEQGEPTYVDLDASQMHFNFSSREDTDLIRGIPEIASKIIPIMGLDDIQYLITMAVKLASALAVTRESTDGNPQRSNRANFDEQMTDITGASVTVKRAVEEIFPGIIELSTNNKESLKALEFNRPSMNEEGFIARIEASLLHDLWPRSLIYSDETRRAGTRAIAVQANTICTWDQTCLERDATWIGMRWTEFAMRMGQIPVNDNLFDPYDFEWTVPAKFSVDEGNDSKTRLLSLGRCTISRGIICELEGYLAEEIEEQREAEEDRLMASAERLAKNHPWLSEKECLLRLDAGESNISFTDAAQTGQNSNPNAAPKQTAAAPPDKQPAAQQQSVRPIIIRRMDKTQTEYQMEQSP